MIDDDKAVGMLVALAAGDALGWPQENRSNILGGASARDVPAQPQFRNWSRNGGTQYGRYLDPVGAGEYSDDTQLTLAVARSCERDDWFRHLTSVELPFWPTYQRGGGGAVLTASRAWADGHPPWIPSNARSESKVTRYFDAGANGVAMRVAPHALITANDHDDQRLIERVIRDGVTTHGHPRALVGAVIHALVIRHALRHPGSMGYGELIQMVAESTSWRDPHVFVDVVAGEWLDNHLRFSVGDTRMNPPHLWERTCAEVDELLELALDGLSRGATANDERTLSALGVFDKNRLGAGTVCAVAALYVASRTAPRPMSGLMRTAFLRNADTDTLCSMTGATLGALHGSGWLGPLFADVQDREYLVDMALRLATLANGGGLKSRESFDPGSPTTSASTKKWTKALFDQGEALAMPDGRPVHIESIHHLETKTRSHASRARLRTDDDQTIIVDRIAKTPARVLHGRSDDHTKVREDDYNARAPAIREPKGSPVQVAPAGPSVVAVELRVADLAASERFFAQVLGFDCERVAKDTSVAGPLLRLSQAKPGVLPVPALRTVVTVSTADVRAVETRAISFGGIKTEWARNDEVLWLLEPGGNVVRAVLSASTRDLPAPLERGDQTGSAADEESLTSTAAEVAFIQDALFDTKGTA